MHVNHKHLVTNLTSDRKTSKPVLFTQAGSQLVLFVVAECIFRNLIWKWVKYNSEQRNFFSLKTCFHICLSKIEILIIFKLQICTLWHTSSKCKQCLLRSLNIFFFLQTVINCQNLSTASVCVKNFKDCLAMQLGTNEWIE